MPFIPMNKNQLKKFHKNKKIEKIYKLGSADIYLQNEIKSITEDIEKLIITKFSTKTKANVINFFKEESETKTNELGSKNRNHLIKKMEKDYEYKSFKQLNFFIDNVAFKYNDFLDKPLINWGNSINLYNQLKKNYTYKKDNQGNIYQELEEEKIKGEFLAELDKKYAVKKIAKIYCLEEYLKEENEEFSKMFITFTNVSKYHYYTLKDKEEIDLEAIDSEEYGSKRFVKNPKYDESLGSYENSIIKGMEKQKEINRFFYKDLKKRIERTGVDIDIYHFTIFEPHKSLQPHSHKMLIFPRRILNLVHRSFNLTKAHFDLKQVKIEEIEHKASTYITKYLIKTLNMDKNINVNFNDIDENDYFCREEAKLERIEETKNKNFLNDNFFNIYRRYFGSNNRIFTSSNFKNTTQRKIDIMYKYLKENHKQFLESLKKTGMSLYYQLEKLEEEGIFSFEKGNKIAFTFNVELLTEEYNKYFKEEKKKLYKLIQEEKKDINNTINKVSSIKAKNKINNRKRLFNLYKKHKNSITYSLEMTEERKKLHKILTSNSKNKILNIRTLINKINKPIKVKNLFEYSKEEKRILLAHRLIQNHNIKINLDIPLSVNYLKNYCSLQARERILREIKIDHNLLMETDLSLDIVNKDTEIIEEKIEHFKKRVIETINKTKYLKIRNDKVIKNAYFNKSFDYETKESSNSINIYKEDMYIDLKGDLLDLELTLLSLLEK